MIFGEGPIIKNIAGDLNKLFLQGTRAGQPINNVEGDAAADQGTVQLMADRDPVIRDISTGLGWAGREVTVSGTGALQLVNSLGRPLKSWSVELAPYQEGSGDPSPDNVRPIYGTNKVTIVTAGVNLCDPASIKEGYYVRAANPSESSPIGSEVSNALWNCSDYILVNSSTQYTTIVPYYMSASAAGLVFFDAGKNAISGIPTTNQNNVVFTFTTPNNCKYVRFSWNITQGNPKDALLGEGTQSEYVPYIGSSSVITLPQTIYNGSLSDDGAVSNWGVVDLGTQTWTVAANYGEHIFYATINDKAFGNVNILCKQYDVTPLSTTTMPNNTIKGVSANNKVYIRDDNYSDAVTFKTAMNGVQAVYELVTPVSITLTTPDIPTPTGDATAWATAEDGIVTSFSATYLQAE